MHASRRRIVEVGAGYSTAVMLDVAERYLPTPPQITCIDPEPQRLRSVLRRRRDRADHPRSDRPGHAARVVRALEAGDILFIDSSHVLKLGSDVAYLFLDVLPRLGPGVFVHIHDIAMFVRVPARVVRGRRAWNEAPVLRAFLAFNQAFRILYFCRLLMRFQRDAVARHMPLALRQPKGDARRATPRSASG